MSKKKPSSKKTGSKKDAQQAAGPEANACPKGGSHQWEQADGGTFCQKCHEPQPKTARGKKSAKPAKAKKARRNNADKLSAIDAAAKVLAEAKQPMNTRDMIEVMSAKGYWASPGGKTPWATLYTVVTSFPKRMRLGIDCCPRTGCDRLMGRDGSRGKPLMIKGLPRTIPIPGACHGRRKGHAENEKAAIDASNSA